MALTNTNVQTILRSAGYYAGNIDNIAGPQTTRAVNAVLKDNIEMLPTGFSTWPIYRKTVAAVQILLKLHGFPDVGDIDGLQGRLTEAAFEDWDYKRIHGKLPDPWRPDDTPANPPVATNWGTQATMNSRFGPAGGPQCTRGVVTPPFTLRIAWDLRNSIRSFKCHEAVADSANRVYAKVASAYSPEQIKEIGLDLWGGCYNYRKKVGGTTLSTHAYGLAIDTDPERNQLRWNKTKARLARPDAEEWWRIWESEGWLSLGRARDFDWMHVQAPGL